MTTKKDDYFDTHDLLFFADNDENREEQEEEDEDEKNKQKKKRKMFHKFSSLPCFLKPIFHGRDIAKA